MVREDIEVAVIGAGPAGLAASLGAWQRGARRVLLLDREGEPGGILKQCIHNGFGLQYFGQDLTGPEYADRFWTQVAATEIDYRPRTMVTALSPTGTLTLFSAREGRQEIRPGATVLSTGCRERTRGNLALPGTRPAGVLTAGTAQRLVNIGGYLPGRRVVVLGSGDIGLIMARRMVLEGAEVVQVAEILPYAAGLPRNVVQCLHDLNIPLRLRSTVTRVLGSPRLEAVEITSLDSGHSEVVACDLLLLAVGLIPENELACAAGIALDPLTSGPRVDERMQTSCPRIWSAGNSLHVSDLADYVSLEAYAAGTQAAAYALGELPEQRALADVLPGDGVCYVVPQQVDLLGDPGPVSFSFRVREPLQDVVLGLWHEDRMLVKRQERVLVPGEMVKWPVERAAFASAPGNLRMTASGTPVTASGTPVTASGTPLCAA